MNIEAVDIRVENIRKTFMHNIMGEITAVDNVNLEIKPGELLTLLGPSGCGKTTTLRIIAGFENPDSGRIHIGREDVTEQMANQRNIGFVFQNYALFPHLSIFENVAYGLRVQKMPSREIREAVSDVLKLVGLEGYDDQFPNQISGGQQQRVALARAIVIKPRVLLFDEPLSNLDAKLRVYTRSEIRRLQKSLSITTVYVTHDQEEAMAISDRIVVMNKGEIEQIGTAEELYFSPSTEFVAKFIGKVNTFQAEAGPAGEQNTRLTIFGHIFEGEWPQADIASDRTLNAFVRPEFVKLQKNTGEGHFTGVIAEVTFLGEKVEYVVDVEGSLINASSSDPREHGIFSLGQKVGIQLIAKNIKIL
jgi:iron(III) transport system ATP-binding protein